MLLLEEVVLVGLKLSGDAREGVVGLGGVLGRRADDERRPRLIDQDRVGLVDDPVIQPAMHLVGEIHDHVVSQVIEPELAVLPIGDVGLVGLAPRHVAPVAVPGVDRLELDRRVVDRALLMRDVRDAHPEGVVDRCHPAGPGLGEVVVGGHEVRALPGKRVRVEGE